MNAAGATSTRSPTAEPVGEQTPPHPHPRRVREEAKDGLAVIAFSAVASVVLAALLVLLTTVAA